MGAQMLSSVESFLLDIGLSQHNVLLGGSVRHSKARLQLAPKITSAASRLQH